MFFEESCYNLDKIYLNRSIFFGCSMWEFFGVEFKGYFYDFFVILGLFIWNYGKEICFNCCESLNDCLVEKC